MTGDGRAASRGCGLGILRGLLDAALPLRALEREIAERLPRVPTQLNPFGYDPFGMHPDVVRQAALPFALLYRYYFRVETHGIERVPPGNVLLIANHAGQLPFDAAMLAMSMLIDAEPPRIARTMAEYWIPQLPFVNVLMSRGGVLVGTPQNCAALLRAGECVSVFPEGVRGMNKTIFQRYRLQRFGLGFMRLALETGTPIVPIAIVGSEEQQPGFANLPWVGRLLGMPAFPLTLGFPWLGPLGLLPLPVRYHVWFGEPLAFSGSSHDEDGVIEQKVAVVREAIEELFARGLGERRGIFR